MAADLRRIPEKLFYKTGEVCQYTDTQPYVLRFWESEFPQLAPEKNRTGQRVYRREDIELIFRIKRLLYDEEYTIAGARRQLEAELSGEGTPAEAPQAAKPSPASARSPVKRRAAARLPIDGVDTSRSGPDHARGATTPAGDGDSLERLRDALAREESARQRAEAERDALRERQRRAAQRLRGLLERPADDRSGP